MLHTHNLLSLSRGTSLALVVLAFAVGCASSAPMPTEVITTPPAAAATEVTEATPARPWSAKLVPVKGAPTRQEVRENGAASTPTMWSAEEFLVHVQEARGAISHFKQLSEAEEAKSLYGVTTWKVSEQVMRALVKEAMQDAKSPVVVQGEDVMGYPRVVLVWTENDFVRLLRLSENNDNTSLSLKVKPGKFDPATLGLKNTKVHAAGVNPLEVATFIGEDRTVYPHIEEYVLEAPGFITP